MGPTAASLGAFVLGSPEGHVDVMVDDPDAEVARAVSLGASRDPHQPSDGVVVMRDPDGNPFCLFLEGC